MPKRTRLKSAARTHSKDAQGKGAVHDRRAQELPANAMVAPVEIDDPYEPGAKIIAFQSLRDSPINYLRARGQIDEAQYNAGKKLQTFYERAEIGGIRAVDPTREKVDCGRITETLTERVQDAIQQVIALERVLGTEGAALARHVLCYGYGIAQCAQMRGMTGERGVRYIGTRFREVLETLAVEMKLVGR